MIDETGLSTCINLIKCRFLDTSLLHVLWFQNTTLFSDPFFHVDLHRVLDLEEKLLLDQGSHLAAPHKIFIPVELLVSAPS